MAELAQAREHVARKMQASSIATCARSAFQELRDLLVLAFRFGIDRDAIEEVADLDLQNA